VGSRAEPARSVRDYERLWWRNTFAVLRHPRTVFAELREDESDEGSAARQEPLVAIVWLAGIAAVLASSVGANPLDDRQVDNVLFTVWVFLAGGAYGFIGYWLLGGALHLGARAQGSVERYRRARHLLAFAVVPVALSLPLVWPIRLGLYGSDLFRSGGSDTGGGNAVFAGIEAAFGAWSAALLVLGVSIVYGWSWGRALAAVGLAAVIFGLFGAIPFVL
jgi:hypothetical protein